MFEIRSSHSVTVLPNSTSEIATDIMILLPVHSYASFTLPIQLTTVGLCLLNQIHLESYTGTVSLIVRNFTQSNIFIDKLCTIATMIVNPKVDHRYFCIESYQFTRSPYELDKFVDVCKAKEEDTLFKI